MANPDSHPRYNFNDSVVTEIKVATVRASWGGATSKGAASSYGANAYMLMYRKLDGVRNKGECTHLKQKRLSDQMAQSVRARWPLFIRLNSPILHPSPVF